MTKIEIGIFGLTGCGGDQLAILNCEDELLKIVSALDLRDFVMASSANDSCCSLDVAFVEGAIVTHEDQAQIQRVRERSTVLVAIGTCAVSGGIAAPAGAAALKEAVEVDVNIPGCPIEKGEFLSAVSHLLNGNVPVAREYPVCAECRMLENNCLYLERGQICCGPLTVGGCDARCPGMGVPCIGCRGPAADANFPSALAVLGENGTARDDIARRLRTFARVGVRP
jgi:sulfhydrogenase subunit delta